MSIKDLYTVRQIPTALTHEWLLHKHYAKRIPSISYAFGLYDTTGTLQGICTFGSPPSRALVKGVCGGNYMEQIVELNRLCVNEGLVDNSLGYFVSKCLNLLPKWSIVISYADTSQGHTGYIYQACNFMYTGLSAQRTEWRVKGLEHLHSKSLSDGETKESLVRKYGDKLYYAERPQKHRYIYIVGSKKSKQYSEIKDSILYKVIDYPKGDNHRYDSSYEIHNQSIML